MMYWIVVYHRGFLLSILFNTLEARIIPTYISNELFRNAFCNDFGTLDSYTFFEM